MSSYSGKNILISGGLGFIGSNLARSLCALGANVTIIDAMIPNYGGNYCNILDIHNKINLHIADVRDVETMRALLEGQDIYFNLAAQTSHLDSMLEPRIDLEINTIAQLETLELCRKYNPDIKIVFTSTRQVYGQPLYLPVDEAHPLSPPDVNAINKIAAESYFLLYGKKYQIKSCILRLTNTYGPGMRIMDSRQMFLGIWIRLLLENCPIKIFGTGEQLRDFTYIEDCIAALLLVGISTASNGKIYNLGSPEVVTLNRLANMLINCAGSGAAINVEFPIDRKSIDIGDCYSNYSLIKEQLGWEPLTPLSVGLQQTFVYYKDRLSNYI